MTATVNNAALGANAELTQQLDEALARERAMAEVLAVINSSPSDLVPVFQTIVEKAHALCDAAYGSLQLWDGERFRGVAMRGFPEAMMTALRAGYSPATMPCQRLLEGESVAHCVDLAEIDSPVAREGGVKLAGIRTILYVALRKDGVLLGQIVAARKEVRPFTDKEIALVESFAAQAVIAMENARLITETREALDQQTATAEVLQVINSSPGDLTPVFEAMLDKALHLCEASFGFLLTYDGEGFQSAADRGHPAFAAWVRAQGRIMPEPGTANARIAAGERVIHIADVVDDPDYQGDTAMRRAVVEIGGFRTVLTVALRKADTLLGIIHIYRQEVRLFTDRQVALLQNFAAQAVIAMEHARLLTETRQRSVDLQEALEYQTATSDVLKVISRSTFDLEPVLEFVLETVMRLCDNDKGEIFRLDSGLYRLAASRGLEPDLDYLAIEEKAEILPGPDTLVGRTALEGRPVHILDAWTDPHYGLKEEARLGNLRTMLGVPLLREGVSIGVICTARSTVEPFTDRQIELVRMFADQAVIAMENARLLGELRERTEEVAGWNRELEARVAAQLGELERTGKLRRFLAPQLADLIVAQGDESILESHRREIVVVFCDLRGFTAFAERAEPEEVMALLGEYHAALGPIVTRFEGTLDHYAGDGIMVFFNDPVPTPEPAKRAIEMAVAMREAAQGLLKVWRGHGHDIGFGVGVSQGYATLGQIGFAERMDYTAIGTVTNLAARLCGEAKDGQILISRRVAVAVKDTASLEEIGDLSLKGLSQAVAVYNVAQ